MHILLKLICVFSAVSAIASAIFTRVGEIEDDESTKLERDARIMFFCSITVYIITIFLL